MKWVMQVKMGEEWRTVQGVGLPHSYEYDDKEEAERMLGICYPEQLREERLFGEQLVRAWPKEELNEVPQAAV